MTKKKILAWCDFLVPTGFANVAKNLFEGLSTYYDLSVIGINYYGSQKYDTSKYFVYPVSKDDIFGAKRLMEIAKKDQPDLIFLFQDIFHISDLIQPLKEISPKSKVVVYFPIDGAPFSIGWGNVLEKADALITYSDWAIQVIKNTFPNSKKIYKMYHGVDTNTFKPLTQEEILQHRQAFNLDMNKFVVSNVNRFQPRKNITTSLRAFSMFSKGYKICKCGNHFPFHNASCDLNMCPPSDVIAAHPDYKSDVFLYLHMMPNEMSMGPGRTNTLQHHLLNCGFEDSDVNKIIGINGRNIYGGEVTEDDVNCIYNISNYNLNVSVGEGAGLSLLESAATGTPSIAPKNSAIPEQLNGTGILVSNATVYTMPNDNAHIRPLVDPWQLTLAFENAYQDWVKSGKGKTIKQECIDNINTNFLWDDKRDLLLQIFNEVLNTTP